MKRRMTLKLFLVLLLTMGLVVVAMLLMTRWSFQRGFTDYLNQLDEVQVGEVVERLQTHYQEVGSWQQLQRRPRKWRELSHNISEPEGEMEPDDLYRESPPDHRPPPGRRPPPDHLRRFNSADQPPQQRRPDRPPPRPRHLNPSQPLEIGPRLALFDSDKQQVSGRPVALDQLKLYPLTLDNSAIGWLGIKPIKTPSNLRDIEFAKRQTSNLYLIGGLVIVVAMLVSLLLARRLLVPIRALAQGARHLANGQYEAQVPVSSKDELGQLSADFNHLANTLAANEAARQRWVADISHELRTPLAILRGEIEAMQDGVRPIDKQNLHSLHGEVIQLNKLVDDLYQLSLADLGALDYQMSAVNLNELLQQVVDSHQGSFSTAGLQLTFDQQCDVMLFVDPDRFTQMLHNLLGNSLRYTDAPGKVCISCHTDGRHARIVVKDSAPGVANDALPQLFERLYREERSRNRAKGGAGLGLAIVQNIVQAHQGTISAEASDLGGLMITITVPLYRGEKV
jgi:two-component system sensor histidine kinase BaeS